MPPYRKVAHTEDGERTPLTSQQAWSKALMQPLSTQAPGAGGEVWGISVTTCAVTVVLPTLNSTNTFDSLGALPRQRGRLRVQATGSRLAPMC